MSVFEPDAVRVQCVNSFSDASKRRAVDAAWKKGVEKHVVSWTHKRKNQSKYKGQLEFIAEVVEYVDLLTTLTRATTKGAAPLQLNPRFPLLGPHFIPPSVYHAQRRHAVVQIKPELAYLKPVTVIHPAFYPELGVCPQCSSTDVVWYGWSLTGHRDVHGIEREETAIGYQLRCNPCKRLYGQGGSKESEDEESSYSCLTTNFEFWKNREHWDIPIGIPHFLKKSALTRDLFNLIVEFRLTGTAAGIAEHIRQLHLLEYHKRRLEYLRAYAVRSRQTSVQDPPALQKFATPMFSGNHDAGYDCRSVSNDLVSDVYNSWVEKTRQSESEATLRTLGAVTISLDATFRSAGKATITDKDKARTKLWTGGLQSVVNEKNLIIAWRLCLSQANVEVQELLEGVSHRFHLLDYADPEMAVADNCCHVRVAIRKVFPNIDVVLDVWHFIMRYAICVIGGVKSPYRAAVTRDITDAILKSTASGGNPAVYWSQEEQERRLVEAYTRWAAQDGVFSAAAEKVHADQLAHVKKGCLARRRDDVPSDGSRIEGSHGKGWNSIQRSHASGVESFTYLGHDFVLRRNNRIDFSSGSPSAFVASTCGSHHVYLVNAVATIWNEMLDAKRQLGALPSDLSKLPILQPAASGEKFGLMKMTAATAAHYTFVKDEPTDDLLDLTAHPDVAGILSDMGIDPSLAHLLPKADPSTGAPSSVSALAPLPLAPRQSAGVRVASSPNRSTLSQVSLGSASSITPSSAPPDSDGIDLNGSGDDMNDDADDADDSVDDDVAMPDIGAIIQSTPPRKRTASSVTADDQASDLSAARLRDVTHPAPKLKAAGDHDKPPKKKLRLTVPGNAVATTKDKGKQVVGKASSFFTPRGTAVTTASGSLTGLGAPLCLPVLKITGLTRSQQLLSMTTGLDARSVKITMAEKDAFFLFMELRQKYQWASFTMTPRAWVVACSVYNIEVEKKNAAEGKSLQRKTPRALFEKLGEIELIILSRINRKDYKSRSSGGTTFWFKHCHAVPLRITKPGETNDAGTGTRKVHTCTRCKTIMYPGGEGSGHNHKRGVCSDGVYSKAGKIKRTINGEVITVPQEEPPAWPQPAGIFSKGTYFHGASFLAAIEEMYERLVVKRDTDTERAMEYLALTSMLESRLIFASSTQDFAPRVLFKLFDCLELRDCPKEIVIRHEGAQYIHVNYLCRQAAGVPLLIDDGPVAGGSASS